MQAQSRSDDNGNMNIQTTLVSHLFQTGIRVFEMCFYISLVHNDFILIPAYNYI